MNNKILKVSVTLTKDGVTSSVRKFNCIEKAKVFEVTIDTEGSRHSKRMIKKEQLDSPYTNINEGIDRMIMSTAWCLPDNEFAMREACLSQVHGYLARLLDYATTLDKMKLVSKIESQPSITCPQCGRTSYNRNDVEQQYCVLCNITHNAKPNPYKSQNEES